MMTGLAGLSSCSESDGEPDEYANWKDRNETFFATLEDSLAAHPGMWMKFKSAAKDQSLTTGKNTDCIYVKVIESGEDGASPVSTDSVRVSYEGRLIPSATYPEGYIFDTRAYNGYDHDRNATAKFLASSLVDGFSTALYHMHRGDYWRVYIPYTLGYKEKSQSSIPAYSTLIFDLTLIDFTPAGHAMPVWRSRRQ